MTAFEHQIYTNPCWHQLQRVRGQLESRRKEDCANLSVTSPFASLGDAGSALGHKPRHDPACATTVYYPAMLARWGVGPSVSGGRGAISPTRKR